MRGLRSWRRGVRIRYRRFHERVNETFARRFWLGGSAVGQRITMGMERQMAGSMITQRVAGALVRFFALLSVLLAAIGVYGVTSVLAYSAFPRSGCAALSPLTLALAQNPRRRRDAV